MVEGQTKQWTTEKGQKEKQRSTKQTRKAKVRETGTPLIPGYRLRCRRRVGISNLRRTRFWIT
jgi:hypothetical protein